MFSLVNTISIYASRLEQDNFSDEFLSENETVDFMFCDHSHTSSAKKLAEFLYEDTTRDSVGLQNSQSLYLGSL